MESFTLISVLRFKCTLAVLSMSIQRTYFWCLESEGAAMLVHSLPTKSRKQLARDVFKSFATHSGLVYDVTDTDCCVQNGSTHDRVFTVFKH